MEQRFQKDFIELIASSILFCYFMTTDVSFRALSTLFQYLWHFGIDLLLHLDPFEPATLSSREIKAKETI